MYNVAIDTIKTITKPIINFYKLVKEIISIILSRKDVLVR